MLITAASLLSYALPIVCVGLVLAASLHDIAARTVPNGLALALAVAGIALGALNGHLVGSLLSAGAGFILAAMCWRRGWMGGGDVKLLGAAALGMPPHSVLIFIAAVAVAGGLLALLFLVSRPFMPAPAKARPSSLFARIMRVECRRINRGGPLPYACAIAAGFVFVLL